MTREIRSFDLRVDGEGDGRTLVGLAVPYNQPANIHDHRGQYTEVFLPGSLTKTINERGDKLRIYYEHDEQRLPIGISTRMADTPQGAVVHARISETSMGNDILALARDGAVGAFSIAFSTVHGGDIWPSRSQRQVKEAKLHEISVVREPAYAGAQIAAIRTAPDDPAFDIDELVRGVASYRNVSEDEARAFLQIVEDRTDTPDAAAENPLNDLWADFYRRNVEHGIYL